MSNDVTCNISYLTNFNYVANENSCPSGVILNAKEAFKTYVRMSAPKKAYEALLNQLLKTQEKFPSGLYIVLDNFIEELKSYIDKTFPIQDKDFVQPCEINVDVPLQSNDPNPLPALGNWVEAALSCLREADKKEDTANDGAPDNETIRIYEFVNNYVLDNVEGISNTDFSFTIIPLPKVPGLPMAGVHYKVDTKIGKQKENEVIQALMNGVTIAFRDLGKEEDSPELHEDGHGDKVNMAEVFNTIFDITNRHYYDKIQKLNGREYNYFEKKALFSSVISTPVNLDLKSLLERCIGLFDGYDVCHKDIAYLNELFSALADVIQNK